MHCSKQHPMRQDTGTFNCGLDVAEDVQQADIVAALARWDAIAVETTIRTDIRS